MLGVDLHSSRRIEPAHVGCLVDLVGSRGNRRIVWMIKRMFKQVRRLARRRSHPSLVLRCSFASAPVPAEPSFPGLAW
jgi:hypothetical protein